MEKKLHILAWTLICLVLSYGTGFAASVGDAAPVFQIQTMSNTMVDTQALKGEKPIVLVFWATWCPECKKEIPDINKLHKQLKPKGMEILAVDVGINDSEAKVKRYIEKYDLSYPVAFDKGAEITKKFNVQGTPTVIILDKNGIVRYRGAHIPKDLKAHYAQLIADE